MDETTNQIIRTVIFTMSFVVICIAITIAGSEYIKNFAICTQYKVIKSVQFSTTRDQSQNAYYLTYNDGTAETKRVFNSDTAPAVGQEVCTRYEFK